MNKGEISEIEECGRESLDFFSKSLDYKKTILPSIIGKESFFKKMMLSVKRKLFANQREITNYLSDEEDKIENSSSFDESLKVNSSYNGSVKRNKSQITERNVEENQK